MLFKLDLRRHCIETAIRKRYNQSISRYFSPGTDKDRLEKEIDILKTVLEDSDFSHLRTAYKALAGHSDADVAIALDAGHDICIMIDGRRIGLDRKESRK